MRSYKVFAFLAASVAGASSTSPHTPVLHKEPKLPAGWKAHPAVHDDELVALQFVLKPSNVDRLLGLARNVSDPSSKAYGHYLSHGEVDALTAPSASHIAAVEGWLEGAGIAFRRTHDMVEASMRVSRAKELLQTEFSYVTEGRTGRRALRAAGYALPRGVDGALSAVYGLHGLPLPSSGAPRATRDVALGLSAGAPRAAAAAAAAAAASAAGGVGFKPLANVTPAVLERRYGIAGVKPSGDLKNRQAVAEFQGQAMKDSDLEMFFKLYVPSAPLIDSHIHKFVGDPGEAAYGGIEASLDVDYIMGVAPGLLTEFWFWKNTDFCKDLKNWTSTILAQEQPPLVHSVSYGFQGNLSDIGCPAENVQDVDLNFAKLAARGITIIFASGDSGSGYQSNQCSTDRMLWDTAVQGHPSKTKLVRDEGECCLVAGAEPGVQAWTYAPPSVPAADEEEVPAGHESAVALSRQVCSPKTGVAWNGTVQRVLAVPKNEGDRMCCDFASEGAPIVAGYTFLPGGPGDFDGKCVLLKKISGSTPVAGASSSRIELGTCSMFENATAKSPQAGFVSGGNALGPKVGKLWPSWPASSPWVTAVGSTRFIDQKYDKPEMATDQFGSGGGFSFMFPAFKDQESFVKEYLASAPGLPPPGTFPAGGRATPDVAALGEGFRVIANSHDESVGGTSASAPTFAGIVSLLNEARIQAGKPPMGYLNPWLYANPDAFTDITKGTDKIGRGGEPLRYGFVCTKGWDPVTGLGTPVFGKMLEAAMALGGGAGEELLVV